MKRNEQQYQIPLEVVSYKQLYGWTMDEIVKEIGTKNNCTFCGVFRRQALDRGATMIKVHSPPPSARHITPTHPIPSPSVFVINPSMFLLPSRFPRLTKAPPPLLASDEDLLTLLLQFKPVICKTP